MTLPTAAESFYWAPSPCGPLLRCRPLERIAPHVFTTRELRLSDADAWRRAGGVLGVADVAVLNQIHGRDVVVVRKGGARSTEEAALPDGDVLVTDDPDIAVAVKAADCVPLLMADTRSGAVAAVHAGWRGTAAGAAPAALRALASEFGSKPEDLVVAIGPSIGPCCYEVGTELVDAFAAAGHPRHLIDRWFPALPPQRGSRERPKLRLDVAGANRDQLVLAGVPEKNIHACGLCTAMHLDVLTSYRAEREKAGRMAGIIRPRLPIQLGR
ncbi:MAG: peptidoglycan editing factor PgeF [Acidobacteria bacterium]|nr:peptidoglycan editing factor PgeF [Acidobacteriota bacterium]